MPGVTSSPSRITSASDGSCAACSWPGSHVRELRRQLGQDREVVARLEATAPRSAPGTPPCSARTPARRARYAGLMLTRISPALAVANWVSTHSALFCDQMPTRSPGAEPEREQAGGEIVHGVLQLAIGPADVLVAHDQRFAIRKRSTVRSKRRRSFRRAAAGRCSREHS